MKTAVDDIAHQVLSDASRSKVSCCICSTGVIDLSLTDGRAVHRKCVDRLQSADDSIGILMAKDAEARGYVEASVQELSRLKQEQNSFTAFFKSIFVGTDFEQEIKYAQEREVKARSNAEQVQLDLMSMSEASASNSALLAQVYDAWPDYPPDWDARRQDLMTARGGRCEKCEASGSLQAHHKVPFWKGGSNKGDNLELLCIDCHGHAHGKNFRAEGFSEKHTVTSDKDETIARAIRENYKITFMYKKFDETKGTRRTILPTDFVDVTSRRKQGFTRCISGHCDLRNETRRFAVHRMYKVELA
jgi:hypothetical protein